MASGRFNREATMLADKLCRQKKWLEKYTAFHGAPVRWIVVGNRTRNKSKAPQVPTSLVSTMKQNALVSADPTGALRPVGRAGKSAETGHFADQHRLVRQRVITTKGAGRATVSSNEAETPLGWLMARRDKSGKPLISQEQFDAAERLRADFTHAQMTARTTSNWDFAHIGAGRGSRRAPANIEISDASIAAKNRFFAALDELGDEMAQIVLDVCCLESGLEAAERRLGWPRRSGKLVLQLALTRLARHYRLVPCETPSRQMSKIMQWGTGGYRPHIPPAEPLGTGESS